jgi:hypothetical protein
MYNTTVICTYNTPEVFLDTDNVSEDEKTFIRNAIYRQELLDIFGMNEFNEYKIDSAIGELHEKLKKCNELSECISKVCSRYMIVNVDFFGLMILYSYDYMYLTHICVSEFITNGKINNTSLLKLKTVIS